MKIYLTVDEAEVVFSTLSKAHRELLAKNQNYISLSQEDIQRAQALFHLKQKFKFFLFAEHYRSDNETRPNK